MPLVQLCTEDEIKTAPGTHFAYTQSFTEGFQHNWLHTRRLFTRDFKYYIKKYPMHCYLQWELAPQSGRLHFHALIVTAPETIAKIQNAFRKKYGNVDIKTCYNTQGWFDYVIKVDKDSDKSKYQIWKPMIIKSIYNKNSISP